MSQLPWNVNWANPEYRLKCYYSQIEALSERIASIQSWQQDESLAEHHAEFARTEEIERNRQAEIERKAQMLKVLISRS